MIWWFTWPRRIERKLDEIMRGINALKRQQNRHGVKIMADLSRITASVAANGTVIGSAVTLIEQIAEALRNVSSDQGAIDALASDLETQAAALSAAIVQNTPAAGNA
jgi:hypothetical protein